MSNCCHDDIVRFREGVRRSENLCGPGHQSPKGGCTDKIGSPLLAPQASRIFQLMFALRPSFHDPTHLLLSHSPKWTTYGGWVVGNLQMWHFSWRHGVECLRHVVLRTYPGPQQSRRRLVPHRPVNRSVRRLTVSSYDAFARQRTRTVTRDWRRVQFDSHHQRRRAPRLRVTFLSLPVLSLYEHDAS